MIIKLQNGDKFKIKSDEEAKRKYKEYSLLSIGLKLKRNLNIASNFLKSGPNITNFGNAVSALFGSYSPENPDLHYGEAPGVGIKNFGNLVRTARVAREFVNVLSKAPKTKEFVMPGLVGWAPKTKFKGYHASNENPFIPDFFREGWALKTHNAVKGTYIANGKAPGYGFLTKRKYVHPVETTFEKPLIQLGEVKGRTKNGIRNLIEKDALEQGADGIIFKGIADNLMQNLFIAKTLNPDTKIISGPVNIFLKAKKTKDSSNNLEQYALRNNTGGNSKITVSDVYKSLIEAKKYKDSKGYTELVHNAQKEAEEMGLPFSSDLYIGGNSHLPSVKLGSRPKGRLGGYRESTNTIELDPNLLNQTEGKYVPFHEGLHWLKVGTPQMNSPLYNRWKENMQDTLAWGKFYRSEEYKNLAYEDNAKAYARKKVKEALYEDADPYLSIPGELLANGLESGRAIGLEPFAEYPGYGKALEAVNKARNYNSWLNDVKAGTTLEMQNFWKILTGNYLPAVSIPLVTGYNIFNQSLQQLQYLKQGGKMNILEFLKNGSRIHIKKKNRGKFTAYCGGNVTSACIAKAKASGNPTLIKRATFAANARKWKHLNGGTFKNSNLSEGLQFAAEFPFLYALGKAVDPTGISGYSDVKKANKEWESNPSFSNGYNVAMETLGALPIISTRSRIWKALLGFVTGNGFIKDYKEASNLSDLYGNELIIDYFDNTIKPRKEFEKHRHHVAYTDANHLPSPELAPRGSKIGQVITNYDYKYKDHYNYKKYVKHLKGGRLCLIPRN